MTKDANLKKIVRDRMSHTQENYTSAKQTITESPLYTITIVSFSADSEKGNLASRLLTSALSEITRNKYGLRDYVDPIVGWTAIRPMDSLEDYFTKGGGTVPRSRYSAFGLKILVEYLHGVSQEDLISLILPNTDMVILHDTVNLSPTQGDTLNVRRAIAELPETEQDIINKQMQIISEWWEGGLVDIVTSHTPRMVIYIPRESDCLSDVQKKEIEEAANDEDRVFKKYKYLSESNELSAIYKKSAAILLEKWLKQK
jgi:hypothetical protein